MQNGTSSYSEASGSRIQSNGVIQRPGLKDKHTEPWPTLSPEALYGLAGDIVKANDPFTEADQVAILANLLVMFGNVINANAHFLVEHTKHFFRLFVNFVGESAKGRKGQSLSTPRHIFSQVDSNWEKDCVTGGLSSGEGLIYAVRDARHDKDGAVIDPGVSDKRLLLIEEELAGVLKVATREGNSQSAILRQAWDKGDLRPLTKTNPIRATSAHISIIGHITKSELLRYLSETEQGNGFANRFLWLLVRRSKLIPKPKGVPEMLLAPLIERLTKAVEFARKIQVMDRDEEAERLWEAVYPELSEGKPGLFGAIIGRAEVQAMRLSCIYALLDCSDVVTETHLKAALALWDYAEESARLIFGDALGDPVADEIRTALLNYPEGLTRTDINYLFGRNLKSGKIEQALGLLFKEGLARREVEEPKDGAEVRGRPIERWYAVRNKRN